MAGLDRTGLAEGLKRSDLLGGLNRPEPVARLNRHLSAVTDDEPAERQEANGREAHEREWQRRRAAGAADSVSLAAAGMSDGVAEASEEVAIPASTLLGVEEAEALPAEQPGGADAEFPQPVELEDEPVEATDLAQVHDREDAPNLADDQAEGALLLGDQADEPGPVLAGADGRVLDAEKREAESEVDAHSDEDGGDDARPMTRPLGRAPLLDSEPLPATRPGMLRPRMPDDKARMADERARTADEKESFSLPVQRPAFELGSDEPADIA